VGTDIFTDALMSALNGRRSHSFTLETASVVEKALEDLSMESKSAEELHKTPSTEKLPLEKQTLEKRKLSQRITLTIKNIFSQDCHSNDKPN